MKFSDWNDWRDDAEGDRITYFEESWWTDSRRDCERTILAWLDCQQAGARDWAAVIDGDRYVVSVRFSMKKIGQQVPRMWMKRTTNGEKQVSPLGVLRPFWEECVRVAVAWMLGDIDDLPDVVEMPT